MSQSKVEIAQLEKNAERLREKKSELQKMEPIIREIESLLNEASNRNTDYTKLEKKIAEHKKNPSLYQMQHFGSKDDPQLFGQRITEHHDAIMEISTEINSLSQHLGLKNLAGLPEIITKMSNIKKEIKATDIQLQQCITAIEKEKQFRATEFGRYRTIVEQLREENIKTQDDPVAKLESEKLSLKETVKNFTDQLELAVSSAGDNASLNDLNATVQELSEHIADAEQRIELIDKQLQQESITIRGGPQSN